MRELLVLGEFGEHLQQRRDVLRTASRIPGDGRRRAAAAGSGRAARLTGPAARGRRRRSWSARHTARPRRARPGSLSPPPARRSSTLTTPATVSPSLRTRCSASIVEPPVVTTSSTSRQRSPGSGSGPSIQRCRPWSLRSLRTMNALREARGERRARDRDRAHRHPSDGARPAGARGVGEQRAERGERAGQQDRALGVDVVGGGAPAGERDLADHQRVLAQIRQQPRARGVEVARRFGRACPLAGSNLAEVLLGDSRRVVASGLADRVPDRDRVASRSLRSNRPASASSHQQNEVTGTAIGSAPPHSDQARIRQRAPCTA